MIEFCKTISPLSYNQNTVPTLILHGDKDKIAPIRHSKRLRKMLKKSNTENSLIVVKKEITVSELPMQLTKTS